MNKKQMIEEAMGRIMLVREMQENYLTCTSALQRRHQNHDLGDGKVFNDLMKWELEEWRGLMMWGLVADHDTLNRIKAAVHERFLDERISVSQWFHNGKQPSQYLVADDNEFRAMAKKAFAPKENE